MFILRLVRLTDIKGRCQNVVDKLQRIGGVGYAVVAGYIYGQSIADGKAVQFGTISKRISCNGFDAVADGDAGQFAAFSKAIIKQLR